MQGRQGSGRRTCALVCQIGDAGNNGVGDRHPRLLPCANGAPKDEEFYQTRPTRTRSHRAADRRNPGEDANAYATFGGGDADDGEAEAVAEEFSLSLGSLVALGLAAAVAGERRVGVVGEGLHIHVHVHYGELPQGHKQQWRPPEQLGWGALEAMTTAGRQCFSWAASCFVVMIGPHSGLRDWAYKKQRLEIGPR